MNTTLKQLTLPTPKGEEVLDMTEFATNESVVNGLASVESKVDAESQAIKDKIDAIPSTDLTSVAKEDTLNTKAEEIKQAVKNIDLTSVENKINTESQTIQSAIQNIDLSSVEGKVEEVKQAVDNIDLTPIENKVQEGVNFLSVQIDNLDLSAVENKVKEESAAIQSKIDNIELPEIDTTELAKQGENQEATNTKILEEVGSVKETFDSLDIPISAISGLALELEDGKKNIVNALNSRGVQADENKDTLTSLANKVYNVKNPYAVTVPAESSNEVANELFNTLMKSQGYDAIYESVYEKFCAEGGSYVGCLMTDITISGATSMNLTGADAYYIYEEDKYYGTDSDGNLTTFLNGALVHLGTKSHLFDTAITKTKRFVFYLYVDGSTNNGEKDTTRKSSFDYCRNSVIPNIKFSHNSGYFMHFHLKNPELCAISRSANHEANTTQACIYFYTNAHTFGNCVINYNSAFLSYMDLSNAVTHTDGTLVYNAAVRHLDLSKLQTSIGTLINSCTILESVRLDNLESAETIIAGSTHIKEFVLPKVKSLIVNAIQSSSFDKISLPSIESFGGDSGASTGGLDCVIRGSVKELYIPNLKNVLSTLALDNSTIEELYAPELEYVAANIARNCAKLKKINLPKLKTQDHYAGNILILTDLPELEEALLPSLTYMKEYGAGVYCMSNLPMLKHLQISSVVFVNQRGDNMFADGKAVNMIWLELSNEPNAAFQIRKWNPTNAYLTDSSSLVDEGETYANNYEKFLDKFKTGIVDKLTDRTGTSALTMSLNSNLVAQLTDEIKQLVKNKNWNIASV